ncbi:MAG: LPS export ABC transporter periplasmic protein LptC [Pseudomonadota bacterium]|nr:LPS export ABC transporter periplasmic protein LptC [Pseudomonadota bacterium]
MKRTLPAITVALALIAAAILIYLWEQGRREADKALMILPEHVDMQVRDVLYTDVSADGDKWEIRAKTATYGRRENLVVFDQVGATMIMADGRTYRLTAREGRYWTDTKDMEVKGEVVVVSDGGDRITTDELHYTENDKLLHTDEPVMLENERLILKGKGMRLHTKTRRMELLSQIKAVTKSGR